MSFDITLAKLKSLGKLGSRVREPQACLLCSAPKAVQEYEATYEASGKFVIEDPAKIKRLVMMEQKDALSNRCPECGAERVKEKWKYSLAVWWVLCRRCNQKSLSLIDRKCPICDLESKKAKDDFLSANGD